MAQIIVHDLDVFYREQGSGPVVILGHSSTGSSSQWRDLIEDMSRDYRLIAPDHIGYGRTPCSCSSSSMMEHEISIIEGLIAQLAKGTVHLVGHSYGGSILARVAVRNELQVKSLTLIEPTLFHLLEHYDRRHELDEIRAVGDRVIKLTAEGCPREASKGFIDYWVDQGAFDEMDSHVQDSIAQGMLKLSTEWSEAFQPLGSEPENLAKFKRPVQLICAANTTSAARAVVDVLNTIWPSAERVDLDVGGHMSPLTHSAAVNAHIIRFVSSIDGLPSGANYRTD
ncbi:MAG: alpha/beta fold hydrolase [Hyphomicrobiaceae bacterium]